MEKGIKALKISYEIKSGFQNLYKSLDDNNPCILRTLTQGQPHWIVCYGYDRKTNEFFVMDPWLGEVIYLQKEINKIWKPRDYFYFEIQEYVPKFSVSKVKIEKVEDDDIETILQMNWYIFKNEWEGDMADMNKYDLENTNFNLSIKAIYNNEIIGVYSFMDKNIEEGIEEESMDQELEEDSGEIKLNQEILDRLKGKTGFQGVSLLLKPQYRNFGIGRMLIQKSIEAARKNGADYIWGEHLKSLGNIDKWLKKRELLGEVGNLYFTIKEL
jgi:GNAT superfamily N-acetyltransferase